MTPGKPTLRNRLHQQGLTLIEIMVALTISAILMAGVMQIMLSSKQTFRVQDGLARVQENARFAMLFLKEDIRMAGFTGCNTMSTPNNISDVDGDGLADGPYDFVGDGIQGYDYADLPITLAQGNTLTAADVAPDTDILVIMYGSTNENLQLQGNLTADNANIQLSAEAQAMFDANDVLIISDCINTDIFAANNVSGGASGTTIAHSSAVNLTNKLSKAYGIEARVMSLEKSGFYVGPNADGTNSLYRRIMVGGAMQAQELVTDVENMQLQYGEDVTGDGVPNRYVVASEVTDWTNVVTVRVALLLRTPEEADTNTHTETYSLLDFTADPVDDRRLRRVFTSTTKIRNRGNM